jgi:hypothetical protein
MGGIERRRRYRPRHRAQCGSEAHRSKGRSTGRLSAPGTSTRRRSDGGPLRVFQSGSRGHCRPSSCQEAAARQASRVAGVGMLRSKRRPASVGPLLDDLAGLHDHDPVGDRAHHTQIMADEQIAQPVAGHGTDRPADRGSARGRATSSAETASSNTISAGSDDQRAGDGDALALPARETRGCTCRRLPPPGPHPSARSRSRPPARRLWADRRADGTARSPAARPGGAG